MVINLFKPKPPLDIAEELIQNSILPMTIPAMLADGRARWGGRTVYQHKIGGQWHRLSYDDTWRRARDFGAGLIALGMRQGDRVAIICENGLPWTVAYYGQSLAGGIGVPLYTELKRKELDALLRHADARFAIISSKILERIGGELTGVEHVIVVGDAEQRDGRPPRFLRRRRPGVLPFDAVESAATDASRQEFERRRVAPDDLASIVFTSGTTGGMKGVMLSHKNVMSNLESIRRTIQFDEKDRVVMVLPMHHAFPFIIFLAGYALGGELTFENDLVRVRDRLREIKPTLFLGVPALFDQMFRAIRRRAEIEGRLEMFERGLRVVEVAKRRTGVNLGRLVFREVHQQLGGQLKWVLSGGAALNPEVARQFFKLGLPLLQGWGMSEASPVIATQRWVPRRFFFSNYYEEHAGSVGEPLVGVEVALIDVPEKEIYVHLHGEGELIVRGPNVFQGYWRAEEETAAAMAGGWLRTGDLGRIDDEGNIWITGRSKYVIVLESGEKVVPDELEELYQQSDILWDSAVLSHQQRGKAQLGVVVYPNVEMVKQRLEERGEALSEQSVRTVVQEELDAFSKRLAPHKRVTELSLTDTPLPRTAILKVMRERLPQTFTFDIERWKSNASATPGATSGDAPEEDEGEDEAPAEEESSSEA